MEDWFINFIKSFEKFNPNPYIDKGKYVIGYGTRLLSDGTPVTKNTKPITEEEGDAALRYHFNKQMESITKYFPKFNLFPKQVLYGLLNMGYRGGPDYFSNSPKFTKALNNGWDDGILTKDEYAKILKEMDFTKTGNLGDRNERMAAMFAEKYNPADSISINRATSINTPYKDFHLKQFNNGGIINYFTIFR